MKIIINNYTIKFKDITNNFINKEELVDFMSYCLDYPMIKKNKLDFEMEIIILLNKYIYANMLTKQIIISMIGSMIIFNIKYKKFEYLKKLNLYYHLDTKIKYLIFIINNIEELTTKISVNNKFDILDFIFDYNCN
jgi:hypothetical protein